jgi:hypothetical protein
MSEFPQNIVEALITHFDTTSSLLDDHAVIGRSLRPSDPQFAIGVYADEWRPDQESVEIGINTAGEPTLNRYEIRIENSVLSPSEDVGRSEFSVNCKIVRVMLYRDLTLHVALRALSEDRMGSRETVQRFGVSRQQLMSGAMSSQWMFLATTHLWVETETSPI